MPMYSMCVYHLLLRDMPLLSLQRQFHLVPASKQSTKLYGVYLTLYVQC